MGLSAPPPDWATIQNKPTIVNSINGATGAVTSTNAYDIGSFIIGRPANNTAYAVGATIAGSSLYSCSTKGHHDGTAFQNTWDSGSSGQSLVNVGSWRCVSAAAATTTPVIGMMGLWVRYA